MEDDLFPSDFEVLLGSLTLLIREERETETKLSKNMNEIQERVRKDVLPRHGIHVPSTTSSTELVVSQNTKQMPQETPQTPQQTPQQETPNVPPKDQHDSEESPELFWSEEESKSSPLMKKLFKPIAILCHPDKVKDSKKNRFFLLGRKAYNENDLLTLLFILSKLYCDVPLEESELLEVRRFVESRRSTMQQKKDSFVYKWELFGEDQKQHILNNMQIMKAPSS